MRTFKATVAALLFGILPPTVALAQQPVTTVKKITGRTNGFEQIGAAGWELVASGTDTHTSGTQAVLAVAQRPAYSSIRVSAYCTYTGATSGRIILFVMENDEAGNPTQTNNASGADSQADTGAILTGGATTPIVLEIGGYVRDATSATTTRTYARKNRLPTNNWGLSIFYSGTLATNSCVWYVYGYRG